MKAVYKRTIVALAVVAVVVLAVVLFTGGTAAGYRDKYAGENLSAPSTGRQNTYARYLERYSRTAAGQAAIPLDLFSYTAAEGVSPIYGLEGQAVSLLTDETGYVEYEIHLEKAGFYNIYLEYYPIEGRGVDIERKVTINGEIPFFEAGEVALRRIWGDSEEIARIDNQGNQIRPTQIEKPRWETARLKDSTGYFTEPYQFYFSPGVNVLRLEGVSEPLAIRELALAPAVGTAPYSEYNWNISRFQNTDTTYSQKIQGEDAKFRSDPSLYGIYDRSSGATEPASASRITLNMIGGQNWRVVGQWIEWVFDVPENGMYRISFKVRQNYNRGMVSSRSVMIDGEIPCKEAAALGFKYGSQWLITTLQDAEGTDLLFPLEKGTHTVRLEATLGELGELARIMEESIARMNEMYRKILILTGADPDNFRDYRVEIVYPEVVTAMALESKILYKLVDDMDAYTGERSSYAGVALTLARQLEIFAVKPERIPPNLKSFKDTISSLGDSLNNIIQSQLDVDYLVISAPGAKLPTAGDNLFVQAVHEIKCLAASFVTDYNSLGDVYQASDSVDVWILSGRDQSTILKTLIDDSFVPQTDIRVNLRLVAAEAVMPAVVAGTGPDVVLSMQNGDPVNYAVRHAVMDLTRFPDFTEVTKRFRSGLLTAFSYDGGVYALPETQSFNVMFYRSDIMAELGLEPPETWQDLINMIPVIQKNNMNVAIPTLVNTTAAAGAANFAGYYAVLYQFGGDLYSADGSRTMLDTETGIAAFDYYIKFFTHYKAPLGYDFVNRFRSGEIPLGFADYNNFNTLEVFAPEIRGLWEFGLLPGMRKEDGTVDHTAPVTAGASMILANAGDPSSAWEFLKWWTSADVQYRYGRELECVMGAAARYGTANDEAFGRMPWSAANLAVLQEQQKWTKGLPEVPGSYYVTRHVVNAARKVVNDNDDSRETLLDYSKTINEELSRKRSEFGIK